MGCENIEVDHHLQGKGTPNFKMPEESPKVRFSPFEALHIGEKNKIVKRQPMKNTIFISKLSRPRKGFNLRDLFDLEKKAEKPQKKQSISKKSQKVSDFFKNKKLKDKNGFMKTNNISNVNNHKQNKNIFCYKFSGKKMIVKGNDVEFKPKKKKFINNKIKFKADFRFTETIEEKIVSKIQSRREKRNQPSFVVRNGKANFNPIKRHAMRDSTGRFIPKECINKFENRKITLKEKYLNRYIQHLYLKKNQNMCNFKKDNCKFKCEKENNSCSVENILELPKPSSKVISNEETPRELDENCGLEGCKFAPVSKKLDFKDFEDDVYLTELIYESHPLVFKFQAGDNTKDYAEALKKANIICPMRMYEKKINRPKENDDIRVIFESKISDAKCLIPYFDVETGESLNKNSSYKKDSNGFTDISYNIDKPLTNESHLISGTNIGALFFRNSSGSEILLGNLVKPILHDCPFGAIPDI